MVNHTNFYIKTRFHVFLILPFFITCCQKTDLPLPKDYPITCYAATYSKGIYKSNNGGTSWFPIEADQKAIHAYFKRTYTEPFHKDLLYIATTGAGLFTYNLHTQVFNNIEYFHNKNVRSIAFKGYPFDQLDSDDMLIGINDEGVYGSHDSLNEWRSFNRGLFYYDVNLLFIYNESLFAGTAKDLFKWNATSEQWVVSSNGIKNKNIISMDAEIDGKTIYAGAGSYGEEKKYFEDIPCLYKSIDQGNTWVASDNGIPKGTLVYAITINANRPERIYLGTSNGIYRSINNGTDWQKQLEGLPKDLRVFDIKIARMSDGNDVVYAATSKGVFMAVDDDVILWKNKSYGLEPTAITSIVLLPD